MSLRNVGLRVLEEDASEPERNLSTAERGLPLSVSGYRKPGGGRTIVAVSSVSRVVLIGQVSAGGPVRRDTSEQVESDAA